MKVSFYNSAEQNNNLKYAVIAAKYKNLWIFVRRKNSITWEIPGGHIEKFESADSAAERELIEETGAVKFTLRPICIYSVENDNHEISFGKLYYADVTEIRFTAEYEIEEIIFKPEFPDNLSYPDIQPLLMQKVIKEMENSKNFYKVTC